MQGCIGKPAGLPEFRCTQVFFFSEQHQKRAADEDRKAKGGFFRELLVKDKVGKKDRHENAEFVDGRDDACGAVLQGLIIAQPAAAGSEARQTAEMPIFPRMEVKLAKTAEPAA